MGRAAQASSPRHLPLPSPDASSTIQAESLLHRAKAAAPCGQAALSRKPRIDERTPLEGLAALVCSTPEAHGISVVLSGGAVVSIYSDSEYISYDRSGLPSGSKPDALRDSTSSESLA